MIYNHVPTRDTRVTPGMWKLSTPKDLNNAVTCHTIPVESSSLPVIDGEMYFISYLRLSCVHRTYLLGSAMVVGLLAAHRSRSRCGDHCAAVIVYG